MYPNYMNKPTFMANSSTSTFGASTSTFGQPAANTSMFSSMQPSNIFQTPNTSSFNAVPSTQSTFAEKRTLPKEVARQPTADEPPPTLDPVLLEFIEAQTESPEPRSNSPPCRAPPSSPEPTPGPLSCPDSTSGPSSCPDPTPGPSSRSDPTPGPSSRPDPTPGPSSHPDPCPEPSLPEFIPIPTSQAPKRPFAASSLGKRSTPAVFHGISATPAHPRLNFVAYSGYKKPRLPKRIPGSDHSSLENLQSTPEKDELPTQRAESVRTARFQNVSTPSLENLSVTPSLENLSITPSLENLSITPSMENLSSACENTPRNISTLGSGFQNRFGSNVSVSQPNAGLQNQSSSGFQGQSNSGFQVQPSSSFQGQPSSSFQGQSSSSFQGQPSVGFQSHSSSSFHGHSSSAFQSLPASGFQSISEHRFQNIRPSVPAFLSYFQPAPNVPAPSQSSAPIPQSAGLPYATTLDLAERGPTSSMEHQPFFVSNFPMTSPVAQSQPQPPLLNRQLLNYLGSVRVPDTNMALDDEEGVVMMDIVEPNSKRVLVAATRRFPFLIQSSYNFDPPGGTNLFGQQPQPSTSGLFGSSNAFGQNKTTFGFGSTPTQQPGLFGQQPQQQTGTSLFQSNTPNLFGSSAFGNQTSGTVIKFAPVTGTDTMQKNGVTQSISTKHHCITCMKEYESKSLEELRFEDYCVNRKGPQQQAGFGATPFGTSTSGASTSLFGQTENKQQGFGQQGGFGQPAFGQTTPAFGVNNQASAPNLFGKPNTFGVTTSATPTFGFNATPSTSSNPFSATQTQKPFAQPFIGINTTQAQPSFGTGVFGQTNTQNTGTNLFQKPTQPTAGFNAGQQGFSFNQPATTQSSNLFQVSKPNTTFGMFGQTTTTPGFGQTSQSTFGTNFGKLTQPTFTQPTQPSFGTNLSGGLQQQSLFGNTATKPPNIFGTTTTTGSLFNNNVFQQTPNTSFSLNVNQQQPVQFPPEPSDDLKRVSVVTLDTFPDGGFATGLDPYASGKSTTNPKDLKVLLESSKEKDETSGDSPKIKVHLPKPKRGNNYNKEFFETNQALRSSHKCLVIRKFNDNPSTIYNKYKNELLEEAEEVLKAANETDSCSIITARSNLSDIVDYGDKITDHRGRIMNLRLQFDSTLSEATDETRTILTSDDSSTFIPLGGSAKSSLTSLGGSNKTNLLEIRPSKSVPNFPSDMSFCEEEPRTESDELPSVAISSEPENFENPAGVILTRPEYYILPALQDLHQYMDENGRCIVQGLTIGRKGYGNVYFLDPIDITNMNLDEIIHFRHREVIIYPDDCKKPPVGEDLNTRAQVTLDKIYPREKGTNNYITDVCEIIQSNFVDNLMHVTQKHDGIFVDYRPKTGSWVFKVKHFSKYGFTESDEEECEISPDKAMAKKPQEILKKPEEEELHPLGLGGGTQTSKKSAKSDISPVEFTTHDFWPEEESFVITDETYHTDSAIQNLKSSLFTNLETVREVKTSSVIKAKKDIPSVVVITPKIHRLPDISLLVQPEKVTTTQRCYTELGVFKCNTYKVGWGKGFDFYNSDPIADNEVIYSLGHCNIGDDSSNDYNSMMPNLTDMLKVTLEESEFTFDSNQVPTLQIKNDLSYLLKQTDLFNDHVRKQRLVGQEKYLTSVWNLCSALWGPADNSPCSRRQNLSDWLKKFSYDLSDEWGVDEILNFDETKAFKLTYKLLSYYKIPEACEFASKHKLNRLSLLISQISANERYKLWMQKYVDSFAWKQKDIIVDDFKRIYLLLSGIPVHETINTCDDLDWMRSFGVHLWYVAPAAAPIDAAFNLYKKAFEESEYATKPIPPYCNSKSQTSEYDILYHILALYVDRTYQLCKVLHPETHTENLMDYRLSWFILQLFQSLKVGLIRDSEKEHLHTTFSTQLENMGHWKWAIFSLLFLKDNILKKNLITRILDRNVATFGETSDIEMELVKTLKIPPSWIHEVKAIKTKASDHHYDYFEHCIYMKDLQLANSALVDYILPELFVNGQNEYLTRFIKKLQPFSNVLVNWQTQVGLFKEFLELENILTENREEGVAFMGGKLNALFRRISCFPIKNDLQKLCVAELSRKCALLFKILHKNLDSQTFQSKYVDVLNDLVMPPDIKHYEIYYLVHKHIQDQ